MLSKIEIDNLQGLTMPLPIGPQPEILSSSGLVLPVSGNRAYSVRDVEGLDPVKANLVYTNFAQLDGGQFQAAAREPRNIILTVGIEPQDAGGLSVRELRLGLYRYLMPKSTCRLRFFDDGVVYAVIDAMVETCESPLFTDDPEMRVSFMCFNPNFRSPFPTTEYGETVNDSTEQLITLGGDIETGYKFTLTATRGDIEAFTIYNRRPSDTPSTIEFEYPLDLGDIVEISTNFREKYARINRSGTYFSVLYGVSLASKFSPFYPGDNYFRVNMDGEAVDFYVEFTEQYGGL